MSATEGNQELGGRKSGTNEPPEGSSPMPSAKSPKSENDSSLGRVMMGARERRGVSLEQAASETRIPGHYLRMMESADYSLISDQLYLLPYIRRYAKFLQLDQEETAMRFVREVQRAENNPTPVRIDEPLDNFPRRKRRNWGAPAVFAILVAVLVLAYMAESRHRESSENASSAVVAAPVQYSSTSSPSVVYASPQVSQPVSAPPAGNSAPLQPATTVQQATGTRR